MVKDCEKDGYTKVCFRGDNSSLHVPRASFDELTTALEQAAFCWNGETIEGMAVWVALGDVGCVIEFRPEDVERLDREEAQEKLNG